LRPFPSEISWRIGFALSSASLAPIMHFMLFP
jgi:hypothetical protein